MNNMNTNTGISSYIKSIGSSSYRQIELLLERLVADIEKAIAAMEHDKFQKKCEYLAQAYTIIRQLRENLNFSANEQVAQKLDVIYQHLERRLYQAHAEKNVAILKSCLRIVLDVQDWWEHAEI